ncbi:MAG: YceI family protein [Psychrobacter sp.]|uniref:YceI family protein n=1 Tax=unclassified Psychrobacter TaxID=196806 RepID=UPI00178854CC|nr:MULTISPECIES: YceI family protein [unclassified Psychrobacter]MBE0442022.1 polyisoprenoid-binding protein [Psychrobacter sp. FME13]
MNKISRSKKLFSYSKFLVSLGLSMLGTASSYATTYYLDPPHTNVRFAIDHFNTSTNSGGFYNLSGQLEYNPVAKTGSIDLLIPLNTLNTGNQAFDNTLKSADFFDVETFPIAHFKSTKWHFSNDKNRSDVVKVDGMLTLHGKVNPITLTAAKFNCYLSPILKKTVCGGEFTTTIDRTKWGISKYTLLGMTEQVALTIQIEAVKQ